MDSPDHGTLDGRTIAAPMDAESALAYLSARGFRGGYLERARAAVADVGLREFTFEALNVNYCDFCFQKLMGGEYDRLADGRERCTSCTRTVLRSGEEFEHCFHEVRSNLEIAFEVTLNVPMKVSMVNAKEIARHTQEKFEPTPGVDARVLGFATQSRTGYSLFIENGSPRLAAIATLAHELTHIWQYTVWDSREIDRRYGDRNQLIVYEGMATWAQIQYLYFIREFDDAQRLEAYTQQREDEYGVGFRLFAERYPLSRVGDVDIDTPFRHRFPL